MKLFRYWTHHEQPASGPQGIINVRCYGYSNQSIHDALRVAQERAERSAKRWASNDIRPPAEYYGQAIREEIVDEFTDQHQIVAAITRNSYGCLVLNTPIAFIADVDLPQQSGVGGLLKGLFGKKEPTFEQSLLEKVEHLVRSDDTLRVRMYRTKAGFRLMIVSKQIPANEATSQELLERLGSDQLYANLCKTQDCYRARLTPKPWRIGLPKPNQRFPFSSDEIQNEYQLWVDQYDGVRSSFATCAIIGEFGDAQIDPVVENIVALHDHYSLDGDKPLA